MLWIATAAALAANAPATDRPVAPERQARAMVRIVSAARVDLGKGAAISNLGAIVRETEIDDGDGAKRAILVEFP